MVMMDSSNARLSERAHRDRVDANAFDPGTETCLQLEMAKGT